MLFRLKLNLVYDAKDNDTWTMADGMQVLSGVHRFDITIMVAGEPVQYIFVLHKESPYLEEMAKGGEFALAVTLAGRLAALVYPQIYRFGLRSKREINAVPAMVRPPVMSSRVVIG